MNILGRKTIAYCANCGLELKYKYRPAKEWNIDGFLCGDCQIQKTKDFIIKQQEQQREFEESANKCAVCKKDFILEIDKNKPRHHWHMGSGSMLCKSCYEKMELDYEKRMNFCALCKRKFRFKRYNPKTNWKMEGQLCGECWDKLNSGINISAVENAGRYESPIQLEKQMVGGIDNELLIDPSLVKRFEYNAEVNSHYNEIKDTCKLIIHPIEVGNKIELQRKDNTPLLAISLKNIEAVSPLTQSKGTFRKKNELLIEIVVSNDNNNNQHKNSIKLYVKKKYVWEILNQIKNLKRLEEEYWETINLQYSVNGEPMSSAIYYKTPFLANGEEVLWIMRKSHGKLHKHIDWLQALTNFRVVRYHFCTHKFETVFLYDVEDIIITNQHTTSTSSRIGTFTRRENKSSFLLTKRMMTSPNKNSTVGDVIFVRNGKPFITFYQIHDPVALAELAKTTAKQYFSQDNKSSSMLLLQQQQEQEQEQKAESEKTDPLQIEKTLQTICTSCRNINPNKSIFCNKCGSELRTCCSKCDNFNPAGSAFCNKCGFTLR